MYNSLVNKNTKLALVGLGYVGLPIALEFANCLNVIGFDVNEHKLDMIKRGEDPAGELDKDSFANKNIEFTSSLDKLKEASFFIVAVPTPIDAANQPDLNPLISATKAVAHVLKKGDYIVYESTVYPGCTEEVCVPILENLSGLKYNEDFKVGYSPERINPGDKVHTLTNTVKIVSGSDSVSLDNIANVYELVVKAGVHRASCIKVAEAAKIIENTQRDVNIALMNELSIIFGRIGINTYEVLEAAGTKWNFLKFSPGLVGGHCIGVDPYYLVHKAQLLKYHPQIINSGRFVNDSMGGYIGKKVVKELVKSGFDILKSKVLVMGITFKENVSDVRNSKVVDIVKELADYGIDVDVIDPFANEQEVKHEYGISLTSAPSNDYCAVVAAVSHNVWNCFDERNFLEMCGGNNNAILVDIKGVYRNKIATMKYWSL